MANISWAILACNESDEIDKLLNFLSENINEDDEIVVVLDESTYTVDVDRVIDKYISNKKDSNIQKYYHPLNMNFSAQKNFLNSKCKKDFIFNIDADELIPESLLVSIRQIIDANKEVDAYWVPRVNTVEGLTNEDINRWRWNVSPKGWVNWPDWQLRVYRNSSEIKWIRPVHEQLVGYEKFAKLPEDPYFAIRHYKHIDRQRKQNEFYDKIV